MAYPHNKANINHEHIKHLYVVERVHVNDIAQIYSVTPTTIYNRLRSMGVTLSNSESHKGRQTREHNSNWRGGRRYSSQGYIILRLEDGDEVYEHRLIMEKTLGRSLTNTEVVHHINGVRDDNRPENLEILPSQGEHMRIHMTPEEARRRGKKGLDSRYGRAALKAVGVQDG